MSSPITLYHLKKTTTTQFSNLASIGTCFLMQLQLTHAQTFDIFIFTTVSSQWDFYRGKFGLPSPGKASCDRVALADPLCILGAVVFP